MQKKGSRGGRKIFSNQGKGVSKSIREIVLLKMCFCYVRLTCLNVRVSEREEDIHTYEICLLIYSSLEGLVQAAASNQEFRPGLPQSWQGAQALDHLQLPSQQAALDVDQPRAFTVILRWDARVTPASSSLVPNVSPSIKCFKDEKKVLTETRTKNPLFIHYIYTYIYAYVFVFIKIQVYILLL